MMCAVRRLSVALAGLVSLVAVVVAGTSAGGVAAAAGAAGAAVAVRTVVGPGVLDGPGGLALGSDGDLFVADTGHCRVLVVPARAETRYGLRLQAGHAATVAGGSCAVPGSIGHPSGVAVDAQGDVYIAEATAQRVQVVRPTGQAVVTVAGTGRAGFNGDGLAGTTSALDEPTGVAVDGSGDLVIADTANCRVRVLAARSATIFGRAMTAGHLYTVAGTGVCGSAGQGGPVAAAQLWNPVAVAVDSGGDLFVADDGDQSVLLAPARGGTFYGSTVGAGDIGVVVGGTGGYQPYVADGLPAVGVTAELNDPRGRAIGPTGALFVTDGLMQVIRVVPSTTGVLFGRAMTAGDLYSVAGALPVATAEGPGNGTHWVLTRMGTPVGISVSASGNVYYSDGSLDAVRMIGAA
jgi:trimeric autotransporter adhesin